MRTPKTSASRAARPDAAPRADAAAAQAADAAAAQADADVSRTVAVLYQEHYRSLVRLAALLVPDVSTAEEIVQEAFAEAHGTWRTLPDHDAALRYLRRSLVRQSRSVTQLRLAAGPHVPGSPHGRAPDGRAPDGRAPDGRAPDGGQEAGLLSALRALPVRQREVLVLKYFADLPEAEIALVTGTRTAAIRGYAARGMSALRAGLPGNVA